MSVNKLPKPDILKDALTNFDEHAVTGEQIMTLLRVWPKDSGLEELENLKCGANEIWDKAEAYFINLCDPPSIHARLQMWKFKVTWPEEKGIQEDTL